MEEEQQDFVEERIGELLSQIRVLEEQLHPLEEELEQLLRTTN